MLTPRTLTSSRGLPWFFGLKVARREAMNAPAATSRSASWSSTGLKSAVVMPPKAGSADEEVAAITGQPRDMIARYAINGEPTQIGSC
jgi:hypothetical protein